MTQVYIVFRQNDVDSSMIDLPCWEPHGSDKSLHAKQLRIGDDVDQSELQRMYVSSYANCCYPCISQ